MEKFERGKCPMKQYCLDECWQKGECGVNKQVVGCEAPENYKQSDIDKQRMISELKEH